MTKKLCTYLGCRQVVEHPNDHTSPRCSKHQIVESHKTRKRYEHHYDEFGRNIYKTKRWKQTRRAKLALDPLCEHCLRFNISTIATIVDHIIEIEDGGEVWDFRNLQSMCKAHHNTKTGKEKKKRNKPANKYPSLSDFK